MDSSLNTAEMRLHVAFAKVGFTHDEQVAAEALARQVRDWDGFVATAMRNFSLPNMRMHLSRMAPDCVPQKVHDELTAAANASAIRNMLLVSAQHQFKEKCLDPLGARSPVFQRDQSGQPVLPGTGSCGLVATSTSLCAPKPCARLCWLRLRQGINSWYPASPNTR